MTFGRSVIARSLHRARLVGWRAHASCIIAALLGCLSCAARAGDDGAGGASGFGNVAMPTASAVEVLPFSAGCLPRALLHVKDANGSDTAAISCGVLEVRAAGSCDCSQAGRSAVDPRVLPATYQQLSSASECGATAQPACDATGFCACEINQETGADLQACVSDSTPSAAGFCYIDDPASTFVAACPSDERRIFRFVSAPSNELPAPDALTFIVCEDAP